jgi:hypothetical protein
LSRFMLRRGYSIQPVGSKPDFYTQFLSAEAVARVTIDCLEKHRLMGRTKYRLEAYATLRRRVAAVGSRRLHQVSSFKRCFPRYPPFLRIVYNNQVFNLGKHPMKEVVVVSGAPM